MTPPREGKGELLYQTHGKAQMARQLEALTQPEFMEINHMTVHFMNTDREYIRRQNEEYFCHVRQRREEPKHEK